MGGKFSKRGQIPIEEARKIGLKVIDQFGETVSMKWIAGSIRREIEMVGDVDLVVVPRNPEHEFYSKAVELGFSGGQHKMTAVIEGIQVDLYVADHENWGTQLLMWTGPAKFNIQMRAKAKKKGYKLNQYGLFDANGSLIRTSDCEEDVFSTLKMDFIPPKNRGVKRKTDPTDFIDLDHSW